jgi:hypothetical protein
VRFDTPRLRNELPFFGLLYRPNSLCESGAFSDTAVVLFLTGKGEKNCEKIAQIQKKMLQVTHWSI